jgi:hypothetical protein
LCVTRHIMNGALGRMARRAKYLISRNEVALQGYQHNAQSTINQQNEQIVVVHYLAR